ncbi:switch subunit 3 isoform X1 [Wolffia australiana]
MATLPPSPPSPTTPTPQIAGSKIFPSSPQFPNNLPETTVKTESPASIKEKNPCSTEPSSAVSITITIPSHSRWFSFGEIHATERRMLPEFFERKSPLKNPSLYLYYRDFIIRRFRENPSRKITFTEVRKAIVGDVGSVRRVFDFLETWGLINYTASEKQVKALLEEKERRTTEEGAKKLLGSAKSLCTSCKTDCNIVCFATEKVPELVLCARCFVRGSFKGGLTHADFKRIDVGGNADDKKRDWTDKDVLHLLEALLLYRDDWKRVAEHVGGGKSEKDCVKRFIQLPFAEQFMEKSVECDFEDSVQKSSPSLSPLLDASNPIMSQVAFLATVAGSSIVEAASRAAIAALDEVDGNNSRLETTDKYGDGKVLSEDQDSVISEAKVLLTKERHDVKESLSQIVGVQMKRMLEKIIHFENLELLMEREWLQLEHLRNLLFVDQLNLMQQRSRSKLDDGGKISFDASSQAETSTGP